MLSIIKLAVTINIVFHISARHYHTWLILELSRFRSDFEVIRPVLINIECCVAVTCVVYVLCHCKLTATAQRCPPIFLVVVAAVAVFLLSYRSQNEIVFHFHETTRLKTTTTHTSFFGDDVQLQSTHSLDCWGKIEASTTT